LEKINLHSRQKKILSILNAKHGVATGKEISAKIGVSERTIRTDISDINVRLQSYGIEIVPLHGRGYSLSVENRSAFLELFSEKDSVLTREDRLRTLILRLLREDEWCDIGDLEDEMFVSHTTIEKDIKEVKRRITNKHPYLEIMRQGNRLRFEDNERKKRDLFTRFYADNWDYDSKEGIILTYRELGSDILHDIQQVLKKQLLTSKIYLDDHAFIYLALAIYVMHSRIKHGHLLEPLEERLEMDPDMRDVITLLNQKWKLDIREVEYLHISRIKEQLAFLSERTYSKNYVLSKTDITCHQIVNDLLFDLLDEYGIDFTTDDKLFVDLDRHVQALRNGIIAPSIQSHVLGDELRKKHPFLGDVAHYMRMKLSEKCEMDLGIEEEDYILPFIILAEESLYKIKRGKGIYTAVISHYNESITHYLMELLRTNYSNVLDIHGPYSIHTKELIEQQETMLLLTTVQMQNFESIFKVPALTVSPLLEQVDKLGIDLYLTSLKTSFLYQVPQFQMVHYFPRELCYTMDKSTNLFHSLDEIWKRMVEFIGISDVESVDLEKDYYCILSCGMFFCYRETPMVSETVVSLVSLERENSCKFVRNVKTVMYMLMPPGEKKTLGWFYYLAMAFAQYPEERKNIFVGKSIEDMKFNISRNIKR